MLAQLQYAPVPPPKRPNMRAVALIPSPHPAPSPPMPHKIPTHPLKAPPQPPTPPPLHPPLGPPTLRPHPRDNPIRARLNHHAADNHLAQRRVQRLKVEDEVELAHVLKQAVQRL